MFQTASITFDEVEDPLAIHLHNLRIMFAEHKAAELRDGPLSPASLYRRCTQKFLAFYSCNTVTPEFVKTYEDFCRHGGTIRGKIVLTRQTIHGVPLVFEFSFRDPHLVPTPTRDEDPYHSNPPYEFCEISIREMRSWFDLNEKYEFTEKYQKLFAQTMKKPFPKQSTDAKIRKAECVEFVYMLEHEEYLVDQDYAGYNRGIMAKYMEVFESDRRTKVKATSPPISAERIKSYLTRNLSIHRHFAQITARHMIRLSPTIITPISVKTLIDQPLPGESTLDTEIRAQMRMDAHVNPNARFLLAALHMQHADPEVVKRGKLLMQSAVDAGSARAVEWLVSQPQEVEWVRDSIIDVDTDKKASTSTMTPPVAATPPAAVRPAKASSTKPPPYGDK